MKLTREERAVLKQVRFQVAVGFDITIQFNRCFENAFYAALTPAGKGAGLKYVEGFLYSREHPDATIHHAWNTLNGKVVDLTPLGSPKVYGFSRWEYFGVEIPIEELQRCSDEGRWRSSDTDGHLTREEFQQMEAQYDAVQQGD